MWRHITVYTGGNSGEGGWKNYFSNKKSSFFQFTVVTQIFHRVFRWPRHTNSNNTTTHQGITTNLSNLFNNSSHNTMQIITAFPPWQALVLPQCLMQEFLRALATCRQECPYKRHLSPIQVSTVVSIVKAFLALLFYTSKWSISRDLSNGSARNVKGWGSLNTLSTSGLIRPSYTIKATIFEKVFLPEKFPKTKYLP